MKKTTFAGLIAAPFTPFKPDLTLNLEVVPQIARRLVDQHVSGAFVGGSTGEYASLTTEERIALAEAWRKAAGPELALIVHVGHNSVQEARRLAQHAEAIGAEAIGALMPSYFRPRDIPAVVEYCRQVTRGAPKTPFYYYHIPDMTGVNFEMAKLLPEISRHVPTFRGIKFTHHNLMDYSLTLADAAGEYDILFGRDEILLAALAMGASGAVGSTYNYAAALYHKMIAAYVAGDFETARSQQVYVQRAILPIANYGGQSANKAIMAMTGVDCGPVRSPLAPCSPEDLAAIRRALDAIGFFEAVKRVPDSKADSRHWKPTRNPDLAKTLAKSSPSL